MVYTRLLFNCIKESTPSFIKTIPYNRTVKPKLGRGQRVGWKVTQTASYKRTMNWLHRNIMCNTLNYQIFFFFVTFSITGFFFYPGLYLYQLNNRHRQLDVAIEKEKEYQKKKKLEEEAEEDDEDEEEGEE